MNGFNDKNLTQNSPILTKKLAPLDVKLFDVIYIADDFDDELGDEFWFGKECLIREKAMTIEQAVYQITQTASYDERLWAVEKIIQSLKDTVPKSQQPSIAKKRYGRYRGQIQILDGFDDDLSDEFWLGKDA